MTTYDGQGEAAGIRCGCPSPHPIKCAQMRREPRSIRCHCSCHLAAGGLTVENTEGEAAGQLDCLSATGMKRHQPIRGIDGQLSCYRCSERLPDDYGQAEAAVREELPERCEHGFRPPVLPCPLCGKKEAAGRIVTRDDAAEALRVLRLKEERDPHSEAAMQTIVTLCDRVAELEDALVNQHSGTDAVWNEKHELAKRISELECANARLTEERDRLREAVSSAIDVFDEMDAVAWNDDSDWSQSSYDEAAELVRSALEAEP